MGLLSSDVETLEIKLDQDGKPYLPGETISGKIEAVFKKSLKINSVTLSAWAHTAGHFSFKTRVRGEKGGKTRTPRFDFKEDFLKDHIIEHAVDVEQGKKSWDFSFTLPNDLRSSFKGEHGSTVYKICAHVDLSGFDKEETIVFMVNHYRNLNMEQDTLAKVEKSVSKTFGALCCESGPLSMDYVLNKNGFVCGEKIKINLKLDNVSGKVMKEVKAYLTQEVKYHGTYHPPKPKARKGKKKKLKLNSKRKDTTALKKTKTTSSIIGSPLLIGTLEGTETKTFDVEFPIPEVPPSHVDSQAIGIFYSFTIEAVPDMTMGFSLYDTNKITIGNIPHKVAFRTWASDNMYEMSPKIKETYPNIPNYGGEKYVYFETKEVREDSGVVEEATNEKDPIFDDGNIPEDEDSSDDSSDSDDDD